LYYNYIAWDHGFGKMEDILCQSSINHFIGGIWFIHAGQESICMLPVKTMHFCLFG
ncbi:hypothetical protein ACJX0J_015973, partial [Zea mays]